MRTAGPGLPGCLCALCALAAWLWAAAPARAGHDCEPVKNPGDDRINICLKHENPKDDCDKGSTPKGCCHPGRWWWSRNSCEWSCSNGCTCQNTCVKPTPRPTATPDVAKPWNALGVQSGATGDICINEIETVPLVALQGRRKSKAAWPVPCTWQQTAGPPGRRPPRRLSACRDQSTIDLAFACMLKSTRRGAPP